MPSRSVLIEIAHAAARVVERPAAGAGGRAAAAAARLLARHLAVRPAHHAVELPAHGIEPRGDHGAGVAGVLLQAGKARARRLLARDQAPPEAVAEADRPDRQEHVEREGDEPLAQVALGAEGLAQHQPHQEGQRDDDGDHQHVVGDRHAAGQALPLAGGRGGDADDEVAHAVPGGVARDDQQHERGHADQRVAPEQIVGHPAPAQSPRLCPSLGHTRIPPKLPAAHANTGKWRALSRCRSGRAMDRGCRHGCAQQCTSLNQLQSVARRQQPRPRNTTSPPFARSSPARRTRSARRSARCACPGPSRRACRARRPAAAASANASMSRAPDAPIAERRRQIDVQVRREAPAQVGKVGAEIADVGEALLQRGILERADEVAGHRVLARKRQQQHVRAARR